MINISYKRFPEFEIRKPPDPETVYARFAKYAEWFNNNHLKAYNITEQGTTTITILRLSYSEYI